MFVKSTILSKPFFISRAPSARTGLAHCTSCKMMASEAMPVPGTLSDAPRDTPRAGARSQSPLRSRSGSRTDRAPTWWFQPMKSVRSASRRADIPERRLKDSSDMFAAWIQFHRLENNSGGIIDLSPAGIYSDASLIICKTSICRPSSTSTTEAP